MTWQNQPGPQLPWQPGVQFPSQPPAQSPWQAGPQFPSQPGAPAGGYPGQPAPPIPPEVLQAAQTAGLGTPIREYNKGAGNSGLANLFGSPLVWVGIFGGGVGALVGILVPLLVVPFPFNLLFAGMTLALVLLFAWLFRGLFNGMRGGGAGGGPLRCWGCPNGLVYMQGRQINAIRWEQLGLVFRKAALVNGQMAIIGYSVQPVGAPPFEFSVLGGPFGNLANAGASGSALSIETSAGVVSNYGGVVQIQGAVDSSAYRGLGELIEEHLVNHQLPLVLETYRRGQTVAFGQLLVHQRGLSDGVNVVTWDEYERAALSEAGYIQVYKKPAGLIGLQVSGLPNVPVIIALFREIRGSQQQRA